MTANRLEFSNRLESNTLVIHLWFVCMYVYSCVCSLVKGLHIQILSIYIAPVLTFKEPFNLRMNT